MDLREQTARRDLQPRLLDALRPSCTVRVVAVADGTCVLVMDGEAGGEAVGRVLDVLTTVGARPRTRGGDVLACGPGLGCS